MKTLIPTLTNLTQAGRQWQLVSAMSLCGGSAFNYIKPEHDRTQASLYRGLQM